MHINPFYVDLSACIYQNNILVITNNSIGKDFYLNKLMQTNNQADYISVKNFNVSY